MFAFACLLIVLLITLAFRCSDLYFVSYVCLEYMSVFVACLRCLFVLLVFGRGLMFAWF